MLTTEQARGAIWDAITAWRGQDGATKGPYAFADAARVSASMLYQFARKGGPRLGHLTVNKLAPLLPLVPRETWLAAMGVNTPEPSSEDAQQAG